MVQMVSKGKISELIKNLTLVHPPEVNSTFSSSLQTRFE